ncbi:kinase-like domain-containing protein [Rhodocollybia butyracea]|uniref:non-specific serine/threonine protein kinase n=1 Tax=Rhodocollybia butyracea TaxID=206335 RepID=A0A9P5U7F1_9AGAR|nr:kinase-like domain-containing protein [Rhodocollybia butyracea]
MTRLFLLPRRFSFPFHKQQHAFSSPFSSLPPLQVERSHSLQPFPRVKGVCFMSTATQQSTTEQQFSDYLATLPGWIALSEPLGSYRSGGYRPTVIGEQLHHGRYKIIQKLGHGIQSTVWLSQGRESATGNCMAMKIFTAEQTARDFKNPDSSEIQVTKRLTAGDPSHPGYHCIPRLLDSFSTPSRYGMHNCLVTKLLGFDFPTLSLLFPKDKRCPEFIAKMIMRDVLSALDYCHTVCHLIHTDVKFSNIIMRVNCPVTPSNTFLGTVEMFDFIDKFNEATVLTRANPMGEYPMVTYLKESGGRRMVDSYWQILALHALRKAFVNIRYLHQQRVL